MSHYFIVIDGDPSRRNRLARELSRLGHAIPLADANEMAMVWPSRCIIFVHDDGARPNAVRKKVLDVGDYLPIIAYNEVIMVERVVQCVNMGITDYLQWPFELAAIEPKLILLEASLEERKIELAEGYNAYEVVRSLTQRERQVIEEISAGRTNKEIGQHLGISSRTVEIHRANMMGKLEAKTPAEAAGIFSLAQSYEAGRMTSTTALPLGSP